MKVTNRPARLFNARTIDTETFLLLAGRALSCTCRVLKLNVNFLPWSNMELKLDSNAESRRTVAIRIDACSTL